MPMTSRQRVQAVLNHEVPDRVPIIIGASNATGISMPTYLKLADLLGVKAEEKYLYDWPELGTAQMDERILERLHSDVRGVGDREPAHIRALNAAREPGSTYMNSWGVGSVQGDPGMWFPSVHTILSDVSPKNVLAMVDAVEEFGYY